LDVSLKADYFDWVVEPFLKEPSLIQKSMFGCLAYYLYGKLVLVTTRDKPPWGGLLVPTEKAFHESLKKEIPSLEPHPVLGKWLYLPEENESFEASATKLTSLIRERDVRIGVKRWEKRSAEKESNGRPSANVRSLKGAGHFASSSEEALPLAIGCGN
jgi:hypothetical protein